MLSKWSQLNVEQTFRLFPVTDEQLCCAVIFELGFQNNVNSYKLNIITLKNTERQDKMSKFHVDLVGF
jgi:hypothetical protein